MTTTLVIGLLIPLLGTMLGSAFVFFMRGEMSVRLQKALLGFASGVMLAASVWSLLMISADGADAAAGRAVGGGGFNHPRPQVEYMRKRSLQQRQRRKESEERWKTFVTVLNAAAVMDPDEQRYEHFVRLVNYEMKELRRQMRHTRRKNPRKRN